MSDFADFSSELRSFEERFPLGEARLSGGRFPYLLAGPADAPHTIVFLNGGMNSHEMWMRYIDDLSRDFRVLAFDYPEAYQTDQALVDGIHELIGALSLGPVVLVGASMGGIVAQLLARAYPQDVEGMCLMSTAGLTAGALDRRGATFRLLDVVIALMRVLPYSWFLRAERKASASYVAEADDDAKAYFADMFDHVYASYTREKDLHVSRLMRDFGRQEPCRREDFAYLAGRVLLLLPEDDSAFPPELQQELVDEQTDPVVVPGIKGGHLTTMLNYRDFIAHLRTFVAERL